jgi:two-component system, OmpR family, sensor histidine kinase KdpD
MLYKLKLLFSSNSRGVQRVAILAALFVLTIVGALFYTIITLHEQKLDALVVDLAGRQRMLNERHMKEILLVSHGSPAAYGYTREVLTETGQALTNGGPAILALGQNDKVDLPPAPTVKIREKLKEQKRLLAEFTVYADAFLQIVPTDPSYAAKLRGLLERNARLHDSANETVRLLADHSKSKIAAMIVWEMVIGLIVMAFGILLAGQIIHANRALESEIAERKRAEHELRLSEARQAEAFRQSDSLKSALLSSVSHELRTPLTSMKTSASSLMENFDAMTAELRKEFLEGINEEIDYLNRLVDNLLDMSRIEAGMLAPRREWYVLEDLVEGAIRRLESAFAAHQLDCRIPEDFPSLFVDGVQIQQVLVNLLDNAMKYSPKSSSVRIDASVNHKEVEVRVSNSGDGIPADDLSRIFQRFYRVPADRAEIIHGTGLGLAICKGIVEAHGGRIWAESTPGQQTSISFTLPQTEAQPALGLER